MATSQSTTITLQASRAMKESLDNLQLALQCSLCQGVYRQPMTLACAHSFCCECIDAHACNSWHCPQCGELYSMQTTGSFRKVNPTLESMVTSWQAMVHTLHRAPPDWWKEGGDVELLPPEQQGPENDDDNNNDDDDDESIDLQQMRRDMDENPEQESVEDTSVQDEDLE